MLTRTLVQWTLLSFFASAAPTADTTAVCNEIKKALGGTKLAFPADAKYKKENNDYYNYGLKEQGAACIAFPVDAKDVSQIVKILQPKSSVRFAVKSGGHDPNVGHTTAKDGVLIAMRECTGTVYDKERQVAYVKPGGHWRDVIVPLSKDNVTVVSGRLGTVGIAGLLLQGGNSFLTAKYGQPADNVVEWEIVFSNGTIANVKASQQPDLAQALRGSGNQFGIVTKFTLKTYPMGPVWGGMRFYSASQRKEVFEGMADFVENNHKDPNAGLIFTSSGTGAPMIEFVYFSPNPPENAFGKLGKVKPMLDLCKVTSYKDIITSTDAAFDYWVFRTSFRTITLPHLEMDHGYYERVDDRWNNITAKYLKGKFLAQTTLAFQPWPNSIGKASQERGGSAMSNMPTSRTRFVLEIAGIYSSASDDQLFLDMSKEFTDGLELERDSLAAGASKSDWALFANDAATQQDVFKGYPNYEKFKKLQKQYDPSGFFATRTGGFKY